MREALLEECFEQMKRPKQDMSQTIAEIHVFAMRLEMLEPGMWWDMERCCLRLRHVAVVSWMERYGFASMGDLTAEALIAMNISLERRLAALNKGLPQG